MTVTVPKRFLAAVSTTVAVALVAILLVVLEVRGHAEDLERDRREREARSRRTVCALVAFLDRELGPAPEVAEFRRVYRCEDPP